MVLVVCGGFGIACLTP
nr:DUF3265 domain-containing protein [Vibrio alginolyticus]